jgi:diguanylate cyclase (GGDEF)-like protein
MVILYRAMGDTYLQLIDLARDDHEQLAAVEREQLKLDHCEVGAAVAERWHLPATFVTAVREHHHHDRPGDEHTPLLRIVMLANFAAATLMRRETDETLARLRLRANDWFSLSADDVRDVLENLQKSASELASLLSVRIGESVNVQALLAEAEERLTEHQIQVQFENDALRESCTRLEQELRVDAQTGLANHLHFSELLDREFVRATTGPSTLALIYGNIDRLKQINATFGRDAADTVIVRIGEVLRNHFGDEGWLARLESDTFAWIMPALDRQSAAAVAEDLRKTVEQHVIEITDESGRTEPIRVTMSIGVAVMDERTLEAIKDPAAFMRVGDHALYAAKASGRNCVRVFTPARNRSTAA